MSSEFTEAHRALVEKIAADVVKKALVDANYLTRGDVKRRENSDGAFRVPDDSVSEDIARRVVGEWAQEQPKWWNVRRRLDTLLAGSGFAALVISALYDAAVKDWTRVPQAIHWFAGTDEKIEHQLASVVTNWGVGTTSPITNAFNKAFEAQLARWSEGEVFGNRSQDALRTLAQQTGTVDNPLLGFVKQALKANPLLMFHGQGVLGNSVPVEVKNYGCEKLFNHWYKNRDELLPTEIAREDRWIGVQEACSSVAELREGKSIDVPFFARFYEDETGVRDRVMLVLHIRRYKHEAATLQDPAVSVETAGHLLEEVHSFDTLQGLVIEYHSTNVNLLREARDTIQIPSEKLPAKGNRFHAGFIDETVRAALPPPTTGRLDNHDLIHSVSISLPDDHDGSELVQVRMMVMVNKEVF